MKLPQDMEELRKRGGVAEPKRGGSAVGERVRVGERGEVTVTRYWCSRALQRILGTIPAEIVVNVNSETKNSSWSKSSRNYLEEGVQSGELSNPHYRISLPSGEKILSHAAVEFIIENITARLVS